MKRILVLLPSVPDPADAGAKLRNQGLLRLLTERYEVDAIAFGAPDEQARLSALVKRAVVVRAPPRRNAVARARDVASTRLPDMALRRWSAGFAATLERALAETDYAAVQAEGIEMARYLGLVDPARRVYDAHNAEFLLQRRASRAAASLLARVYSRIQWRRLERFERHVVSTSRLTLAVSEHDANQLLALANGTAYVSVVPNGLDTSTYAFERASIEAPPNMLLLGKMDFRPNLDGAAWLLRRVLPSLLEVVPEARLFAVGGSPPDWLVKMGQQSNRIAVTGYVADERPYLARCGVLLLPLRIAGGTRLKALVAMAVGVPIVSTGVGMEGLEAVPGEHYLRAETAAEWVDALRRVLCERALRERLAVSARALVERCYDWSIIAPRLFSAYAAFDA